MPAPEVRPQRVSDVNLGIRDLPQQIVADSHLTARPDQEVRIGLASSVEKAGKALLVELLRAYAGGHRAPGSVDDLGSPPVVQRDVEQHSSAVRRPLNRRTELIL